MVNNSRVGLIAWLLCIQYFVIELIVASAWKNPPYNFQWNFISDLGATVCPYIAPSTGFLVCSPLALFMNLSFILNGFLIIIGALSLRSLFPEGRLSTWGLNLLALGATGLIGVGFFPENTLLIVHGVMAIGFFILVNTALVLLGIGIWREKGKPIFAVFTFVSGVAGIIAMAVYASGAALALGTGLVERIIGNPLTIWLIVSALYFLMHKKTLTS